MAIAAVGPNQQTPNTTQASGISQQDFMNILLTQLTYQDPLKPMDNQEFIAQMAQFTTLEQTRQLNDRIDTLLSVESANQSIGLISRTVEIQMTGGTAVGTVTTIDFSTGNPLLTVRLPGGELLTQISPSQIRIVR